MVWRNDNSDIKPILMVIQRDLGSLTQNVSDVNNELNSLNELLYKNDNSIVSRVNVISSKLETIENGLSQEDKKLEDLLHLEKTIQMNTDSINNIKESLDKSSKQRGAVFWQIIIPLVLSILCPLIVIGLTQGTDSSIMVESIGHS